MALLNEYLKLASPCSSSDAAFGGINMIFLGGMAQLLPPMARPLFDLHLINVSEDNAGNDGERRALAGISTFRSVTNAPRGGAGDGDASK
ncbi:hypothetical protein CF326_g6280 [Tilletia indica]|nr:hypothetical protein CF326_g6280 [Tilletia indica]